MSALSQALIADKNAEIDHLNEQIEELTLEMSHHKSSPAPDSSLNDVLSSLVCCLNIICNPYLI